jgi:hypothetical protein
VGGPDAGQACGPGRAGLKMLKYRGSEWELMKILLERD